MALVTGIKEFQKKIQGAISALGELDGELGQVSFDPNDPESIEAAITAMTDLIDSKISGFENNDIVMSLAEQMKDQYRTMILEKAALARLDGDE
jgi:hypothetical protein